MRRIRVLHAVEDMGLGGLEKVVFEICTRLDPSLYDARVWCLTRGGFMAERLAESGLRPEVLGMGPRPSPSFLLKTAKRLREEGIEILHAHGYTAGAVARAAAVLAGTPRIISHVHTTSENLGPKQIWTDRLLGLFTDRVLCCSRATAESLSLRVGIPRRKLRVVRNGVPRAPRPPGDGLRKKLGLGEDTRVLLCAASLARHKGHEVLLDAFSRVTGPFPDTALVLAGDGPLRETLKSQAGRLAIASRVAFAGMVPEIGELLSLCDVAVLASSREGLPLWLLEALSAGKPLVAAAAGGVPEVVSDGVNGFLVPPGDPGAMARAIAELLSKPGLRRSMSEAAEKTYLEKFTVERMIEDVRSVYGELHD
jgi:glycosyltransferase involved in cell wall biosynthesis